jgi:hypothetical protein
MVNRLKVCTRIARGAMLGVLIGAAPAAAGDIFVGPGANLQAAIDAAQPGDRLMLAPDATFVGNFILPNKGSSEVYITIRSAAPDTLLPGDGVRVTPADAANLPLIKSPNTMSALATAAGAHHWRLQWLEFAANDRGYGDIISLGDGSSRQDTLAEVPHHLVLDRVYVYGHPAIGQKRGVGLHSGATWIVNSYISDMKGVGFDTQAIAGYNGPGPYVVNNNYLEGAGENIIIGGASPTIPNLIPSDMEFRRNHMTKPLSWQSPILPAPSGMSASPGSGGSLPAGTYSYRVTAAMKTAQDSWAYSPRSTEVVATVGNSGRVSVSWTPVPNATAYRVYRGTSAGQQDRYFAVTGASYIDSGQSAGIADNGNWITGTRWTVKNVFELKIGARVVVDGNVIEHAWLQAQNGFAVLFTPRNPGQTSPWVYVRDVIFTNNIVRHAGGGVNILGYDNNNPTEQTQRITIRNNVFHDISGSAWGGPGSFLLMGDEPRDIVVDHNTVVHDGHVISAYGGSLGSERTILGLVLTNNLFRHNQYGIFGSGHGIGNDSLNTYFPDAVVLRNTFADGKSWLYPANNEFPTLSAWQAQFVNYAGADYHLTSTSPYRGTGTDGKDLGADVDAITVRTQVALSGRESGGSGPVPVAITTTSLPSGATLSPYAAQLAATGGSGAFTWSVTSGQLPPGLVLNGTTGAVSGTPSANGVFGFTARAADSADATNAATRLLQISVAGVAPQVSLISPVSGSTIEGTTVALQASASDADGVVVRVDFYAGSSLVATSTSAPWQATWSNVQPGSYRIAAVATDSQTLSATCAASSITVTESPTTPPPGPTPPQARPVGEIVLHAADVTRVAGRWRKVADSTAARGVKLTSADTGWASNDVPLAAPADFFEAAFDAPAGVAYHVWFRIRSIGDITGNDSMWVQYSDAVTAGGAPLYRFGTTDGLPVALEDCAGCGMAGWGWRDRGYWIQGSYIQFAAGGTHAIRVQLREDGLELDQIVLTPVLASAGAPGAGRGDATILAQTAKPSADVVIYADDVSPSSVRGSWEFESSPASPAGRSLSSDDQRWSTPVPLASPASYFDVAFAAAAGTNYRVWVRLKAAKNSTANDSVWLQFSDTVSGATPVYRTGSSGGFGLALDGCAQCKPVNWAWSNGRDGLVQPSAVTFAWSGMHTLRVQIAEDGVEIDQIVLSPIRYMDDAPGSVKNDSTIVSKP